MLILKEGEMKSFQKYLVFFFYKVIFWRTLKFYDQDLSCLGWVEEVGDLGKEKIGQCQMLIYLWRGF